MSKLNRLNTIYDIYRAILANPRTSMLDIHNNISSYRSRNTTIELVKWAREEQIITGPYLYCNSHARVTLVKGVDNPLKAFQEVKKDPSVTYAILLCGEYSLLKVTRGGDERGHVLTNSDIIIPQFNGKEMFDVDDIQEEGKLPEDPYPESWDSMDWKVYSAMGDPSIPFLQIGKKLDVSYMTVKRHYEKIIIECKIDGGFFPRGYRAYSKISLIFKTEYEIGLKKSLKKLNKSSYIWKFDDKLILFLFGKDQNKMCEIFQEMEEKGIIHDLHVSIPTRYYTPISKKFFY
jgi:hypothetical protein